MPVVHIERLRTVPPVIACVKDAERQYIVVCLPAQEVDVVTRSMSKSFQLKFWIGVNVDYFHGLPKESTAGITKIEHQECADENFPYCRAQKKLSGLDQPFEAGLENTRTDLQNASF
jgi:hypothetical protein